jgi:hypothetical protein
MAGEATDPALRKRGDGFPSLLHEVRSLNLEDGRSMFAGFNPRAAL